VPGPSFRVVEGSSLSFEDACFDIVVSVYVLQYYVRSDETVLRELTRVLRPGGRLVAIEQVADDDIGRGASTYEYERNVEAAGLDVDRIDFIRRSDSRIVGAAGRFPVLSRLPVLPWLVGLEARNIGASALAGGRYVDAVISARKP
jgi:SAM-dependent methyltransferase